MQYVVIHNYSACTNTADTIGYLIGVFDSYQKAIDAKRDYSKSFGYNPEAISINSCELNKYYENNELEFAEY